MKSSNETNLTKFDRLLPEDGAIIYPDILYKDANDIDPNTRLYVREFFDNDTEYKSMRERYANVPEVMEKLRQCECGRSYCVYVFKKDKLIGTLVCKEFIGAPGGFGKNDFLYTKRIFPEYRHTKYSRYASADLVHMMFKSGAAKRLYSYMFRLPGVDGDDPWKVVDRTTPCVGNVYPTDGQEVQKYISIKEKIGDIVIMEYRGDVYNSMDLVEYFLAPKNRTEEKARNWIAEMDRAAEIVKRTI